MSDDTFLSWAVTGDNGRVVKASAWGINAPISPGPTVTDTPQKKAEYLTLHAEPGQQVHVWIGGGIELRAGDPVSSVRVADATAVAR